MLFLEIIILKINRIITYVCSDILRGECAGLQFDKNQQFSFREFGRKGQLEFERFTHDEASVRLTVQECLNQLPIEIRMTKLSLI